MQTSTKSVCHLRAAIWVGVAMTLAFGTAEPSAGANLTFRVDNDSSYTIEIVYKNSEGETMSTTNLAPNGTKNFAEGGGSPAYNRKYQLYFTYDDNAVQFAYGELEFSGNSVEWVKRESLGVIISADNKKSQSGARKRFFGSSTSRKNERGDLYLCLARRTGRMTLRPDHPGRYPKE